MYTPGTILSIGSGETLEQVTVLTENKVATKIFAGKPVTRRDILSLDDWKLLVGDQEILSSAAAPPAAPAAAQTYPVNTILRWKNEENSRTAIVTKNGVLQIKEVIAGKIVYDAVMRCAKKMFASVAEWKASLPDNMVSVITGQPTVAERVTAPIVAKTDAEYIDVLKKRFHVHSKLILDKSDVQKRDEYIDEIKSSIASLQIRVTTMNAPNTVAFDKFNLWPIRCLSSSIARMASSAASLDQTVLYEPIKAAQRKFIFRNEYRQAIYAFVAGKKVEITSGNGLVGIIEGRRRRFTPTTGATFADLGIEMVSGKPRLQIAYRKKVIDL